MLGSLTSILQNLRLSALSCENDRYSPYVVAPMSERLPPASAGFRMFDISSSLRLPVPAPTIV